VPGIGFACVYERVRRLARAGLLESVCFALGLVTDGGRDGVGGIRPILTAWKLKTGGEGRVIPPMRCDGNKIDKERYAHLRPDLFPASDLGTIALDMVRGPDGSGQTRGRSWIKGQTPPSEQLEIRAETPEPPCKPSSTGSDRT
jgi:hypothetical protein